MSRYIKDTDVYKLVEPSGTARVHCSQIDELPRADVVEVVRCKDCKFYKDWGDCITCSHWTVFEDVSTEPNAFCSYGERREENEPT